LLLAPLFQVLVSDILAHRMPAAPAILPEYTRQGIGRPDLAFARSGQPARAFIELKEPGKALSPRSWRGHDADQFRRFRELPLWALCNFHRAQLYRRGDLIAEATIVPPAALDPDTAAAKADRLIRASDPAAFLGLLEQLALAQPAVPRNAAEMAETLAHAARLTREIVADACRAGAASALADVQAEFRQTLFAHPEAGGYNAEDETALFANAFAQTLVFGLLLAREAAGREVGQDAYRDLPRGSFPLLRATLRALTQEEVLAPLGVAFDILRDTINVLDPMLLAPQEGRDPILYFYEDFLAVFDPEAKRKHGVFFTPVPVVRCMVAMTDRALRASGAEGGLTDPAVLLLDPACGTGTFLIAAASHAIAAIEARFGSGSLAAEAQSLATRLHGFELLVGPYTVAHYRMQREIAAKAGAMPAARLPIFLADTLAAPTEGTGIAARLGFMSAPLVEERRAADELKLRTPILAILGNPPYRRLEAGEEEGIVGGWANGFWDDLKKPVRDAGWGNELNTFPELSVGFWRWALWKLFESEGAPRRGVVCFITNRTFLAGHPYAGLRRLMRQRFDTIEIVDLRGDLRGARPAGIAQDEGVFEIQTGVCIVTAVARGGERAPGTEARVRYADAWRHGCFSAQEKLDWLARATGQPAAFSFQDIPASGLADFLAGGFAGLDWVALPECFQLAKSGTKSQRDALVYGFTAAETEHRVRSFLIAPADSAWNAFFPGLALPSAEDRSRQELQENRGLREAKLRFTSARALSGVEVRASPRAYRPLDTRWLFNNAAFVSRYGPEINAAWGAFNTCLYALPSGTGAGPAVWVHGLLPDYHAFRGSYGGYAFPLWDRRRGPAAHNLNAALLDGLALALGEHVAPEAVFDAIAALLSATSYTRRFAWDLEERFAHIPFPAEPAAFREAARIGAEIRAVATAAREPATDFQTARLEGRPSGDRLARTRPSDFADGAVPLLADGSLRVVNVSARAWAFEVSGYRVIQRWLAAREGEALDAGLQRAILDLCWRVEELLHWFDAADAVLEAAIARPLTRSALGLAGAAPRAVEMPGDEPHDSTA
jgi:hypothetical protein